MVSRCNGINQDGAPCAAQPVRPSGYCYWHDPAITAERQDNRRRGGVGRSNAQRAKKQLAGASLTSADLRAILQATIDKVLQGAIEPGVGNCVANLVKAAAVLDETARAEALQRRLDDLERQAARSRA
jgi:hypothetical protein